MGISSDKLAKIELKPIVLVEKVSLVLEDAIIEGVLKGGDQLVEADLKDRLGISRSPLREAFRDLEKKGLVEIVPRKGTFVKEVTRRDIEEHFAVRSVLEGLAAKEAYGRMNDEDLNEMASVLDKMKKAVANNDAKTYWKYHQAFHQIFIEATDNGLLIKILRPLRMHILWYRYCYRYYKEDFATSLNVHEKILRLFKSKNGDTKRLEEFVRGHIEIALGRFISYLEGREEE